MLIAFLGDVKDWVNAKYLLKGYDCVSEGYKKENEIEGNNYYTELLKCLSEDEVLLILTESLLDKNENEGKVAIAKLLLDIYKEFLWIEGNIENIRSNLKKDTIKNLEKANGNKKLYLLVVKDDDTKDILEKLKNKLSEVLKENNIYIDITHSYRYIPMLAILIIDVLRNLNTNLSLANIKRIIYAKKINDYEYEIRDLHNLNDFMKLTKAVEDFYQKGSLKNLAKIYKEKGEELEEEELKEFGKILQDLDLILNLNIYQEIKESFEKANKLLEEINDKEIEFPLNIIHKDLKDFIKKINDKSKISEKQLELAIWHLKNDRLLLGLITLQESIRSKYMEDKEISENEIFSYNKRNQYKFGVDFLLKKLYRRLGENLRDEDKFNCCNNELQREENKHIKYWCLLTNLRNAGGHNLGEGQEQVQNILNCKNEYTQFLTELKNESFVRGLYKNIPQSIRNLLEGS